MNACFSKLSKSIIFAAVLVTFKVLADLHPQPGSTIINSIGMPLAYIPSGNFTMGSSDAETGRVANETLRKVTFENGFYLGQTEVTQKQWQEVMGSNPSFFKGDNLPVENITWHEAELFCHKLSLIENKRYRLPTLTEWEYACRAGTSTAYHNGDGVDALVDAGWFLKNSDNRSHSVGLKQPNAWGLFDMHGNVSEWCADRTDEDPDIYQSDSDVVNQEIEAERDHRGGSWGLDANACRSASRHRNNGDYRYFDLGLRIVCEVDLGDR